jgi:hypothetical protein
MSVFVVRAFIRLRETLSANRQIAARIEELETRLETHDGAIQDIIDAIRRLMKPPEQRRRRIGFDLPAPKKGTSTGIQIDRDRLRARDRNDRR